MLDTSLGRQPDRQPHGKPDGSWSSTATHRDRPELWGGDRSCYRPELSRAAQEHALSLGCQLSLLVPPPGARGLPLSSTAHSASLPALDPGSGGTLPLVRSHWVLPRPRRPSTIARPAVAWRSPTSTAAASPHSAVGAAGAAALRAQDGHVPSDEGEAAAVHRHVMRVIEVILTLALTPALTLLTLTLTLTLTRDMR